MPIYSAELIHDGKQFLPVPSAIELNEIGEIVAVHIGTLPNNTIVLKGLLCPGFVNAHCHLELSYMHNAIPKRTGLVAFLLNINALRANNIYTTKQIENAIIMAENQMLDNGIVAVGDISNTIDTFTQKQLKRLQYHTFVEVAGVLGNIATERLAFAKTILASFKTINKASIVPHAPYSVSETLFYLINELPNNNPISIHNQECAAEDDWIRKGMGDFQKLIDAVLQKPYEAIANNISSLMYSQQLLNKANNMLLVHNTFTTAEDVLDVATMADNRYWVLCPNANIYIENKLPSILPFLLQQNETICIGTDSLASNNRLCIYSELYTLHKHFPTLKTALLLQFATSNGAQALDMGQLGSFAKGKIPGVLHISNWNLQDNLPANPHIKRLV
jgi:aminodeoxyfutalosine deaminase